MTRIIPCLVLAAALAACSGSDEASDDVTELDLESAAEIDGISLPAPDFPDGASRTPLTDEGGTLNLDGDVRVIVPPGGAEGDMELVFWRPTAVEGLLDEWEDRVRPLGQPFSLSVAGRGVLTEARLEADVVDGGIPEGWELRLIQHAPQALAADLEPAGDPPESGQLPWMLTCAGGDDRRITADFLSLMPDYRNDRYYQLVAVRPGVTRELKSADGKVWLCLHVIDPPVLSERTYTDRVIKAFETARDAARDMGFRMPRSPTSVTVTATSYGAGDLTVSDHAAVAFGNLIMLRNDLHMWLPRKAPGHLERAAAHEYFHVLQHNTMTQVTLSSTGPVAHSGDNLHAVGGNLWAIEGAATWFAWKLYPEASKRLKRPVGKSLKSDPYAAWAFWAFLDERYPAVLVDVYNLAYGHALGSAGVAGRWTRPGEPVRFVSGYEWLDMAEALNAVLEDRGTDLSSAFTDYAVSLLYWADFAEGDHGDAVFPGLWAYQEPQVGRQGATTVTTVTATSADAPMSWQAGKWIADELSAHAFRVIGTRDKGELEFRSGEITLDGSAKDAAQADIRAVSDFKTWDGVEPEMSDRDAEIFEPDRIRPSEGFEYSISEFGKSDFSERSFAVFVYVNAGWTRYARDPADREGTGLRVARKASGIDFRIDAYLSKRSGPERSPIGPKVSASSSRKTHCVAQDSSDTDEECIGHTIAMALGNDEVKDGDLINIYPGTYEESVLVNKQVSLVGTKPGQVIIRSAAPVTLESGGVTLANLVMIATDPLGTSNVVTGHNADNIRVINNLIINGNGGGVFLNRGAAVEVIDNWIAVPRLGIRVWGSPGSTVRGNVVYPATVRDDIQRVYWGGKVQLQLNQRQRDAVEFPGSEPWILTDKAIDITSSPSSSVERNIIGPATRFGTRGYGRGIHMLRSEGVTVDGNTAHVYTMGIEILESDAVKVRRNSVIGQTGIHISDAKDVMLEENRVESLFSALTLRNVENVRTRSNFVNGGTADSFVVDMTDVEDLRFVDESVTGLEGSAGGVRLTGGAGITIDRAGITGGAAGLLAKDTAALQLNDSDFRSQRGIALELQGTAAVSARSIGMYGGPTALRVDDVRFFEIDGSMHVDLVDDGEFIDAVDSRIRATNVYLDPWLSRIFRAENSRIELEDVTFGSAVAGISTIAKLDYLRFEDMDGGPTYARDDMVMSMGEDSELSHDPDLNNAWLSHNNIMGLPFRWTLQKGRLRVRSAVDVSSLNLQLDTDSFRPAWRNSWHGTRPIRGAPDTPLDAVYSGAPPTPLIYTLYPLPATNDAE